MLEQALRERRPLERAMPRLLEFFVTHPRAKGAAVHTIHESLAERTFTSVGTDIDADSLARARRGERRFERGGTTVFAQPLDVAGEPFGSVLAFFDRAPGADETSALITAFAEELDNHLGAVAQGRRKYEVIRAISDALKEPVLDRGIDHAIEILRRHVDFQDLVLVFRHDDDLESGALRYEVHTDGTLVHDSATLRTPDVDNFLRAQANAFLDRDDGPVRDRFGITRYREEVLITGVRAARVIGRMLVVSRQGEFHTYDPLVEALGDPSRFGPRREAIVKNVGEPLVFRALK